MGIDGGHAKSDNDRRAGIDPSAPTAVDQPDLTLSHYNGHASFGVFVADESLDGLDT